MADTSVVRTGSTARDRMIAALIGLMFLVAVFCFGVRGADPSQWSEIAVAAGLRPPQAVFPGVWRMLAGWMFTLFGMNMSIRLLVVAGAVSGACSVMLAYLVARQAMGRLSRFDVRTPAWARGLVSFFSAVAAVLFGVSGPLWDISQTFSSDGLRFLMLLAATHVWLRWFERGGEWRLATVVFLVGVLLAESPFSFLVPVFFLTWYFKLWRDIEDGACAAPRHLPTPYELPSWRMFFLFFGTLVLTVLANVFSFESHGGLVANGWSATDVYFRYGAGYWHAFARASTPVGWALGLGFGIFPIVIALRLFPAVTRDDRPMPFFLGVVMFFVGCVAVLQTGVFPAVRFWTLLRGTVVVGSGSLLAFYAYASALTIALVGASFSFECHRLCLAVGGGRLAGALRMVPPSITLLIAVASLLQVPRAVRRETQRVVEDAVAETIRECGDAKWIFTDGRLDAGIEIAARAHGLNLVPLNMMSGGSEWEKTMRARSFPAGPDRDMAEIGVPALLRFWASEKKNGMDDSAIQLGFEFWKRAQRALPKVSGLVAREKGMDEEEALRGIEVSRGLAQRVVSVSEKILAGAEVTPALASALSAVSWRLSRLARLRNDDGLADRLDATNGTIKKMLSAIEYERQRTFMQMTPTEGLEIALRRADFAMARRYAVVVLRTNPKNPEANFGTAMCCLKEGNLADAETHLRRVLEVRPDEPAALNNLSIVCRKTKRYDEAVALAKHALKMLPDSPEVKQTLADAEAKKP